MRSGTWLVALCVAAVAIRLAVMSVVPPGVGDVSGSYAYRAALLLDGQWDAVWVMWHPPGQAVLIALASWATGKMLSPWWAGNLVSLAATVGLIVCADRLLAPRVKHLGARIACAALLASNKLLTHAQSSPLSEPVFLLAVMLAVVMYDRDEIRPGDALAAGLLTGVASAQRLEGVLVCVGLLAYTAWRQRSLSHLLAFAIGWAVTAGWVYVHWDFLRTLYNQPRMAGMAVPPVNGVVPSLFRGLTSVRFALMDWLPGVLLLPYWMFVGIGIWILHDTGAGSQGRRLNQLLFFTLVPPLTFIALTLPMARTGVLIITPAMIWIAVMLDRVLDSAGRWRRATRVGVAGLVGLMCAVGLARVATDVRGMGFARDVIAEEARVLRVASAPRGKVWAFGDERSIYGILNWPERNDYATRAVVEGPILGDRSPEDFVAALRERGYRYLMFDLPPGASERVPQADWPLDPPRRSLLSAIAAEPDRFRLTPMAAPATLKAFAILD